jgi:haloalkane dehalogenase
VRGMIAQLLVAQHPERVRSLLLTNCDTENDCPPRSFAPFVQLARAGVTADQMVTPALANKTAARGAKGIGGLAYQNPLNSTDEALDYYFTTAQSCSFRKNSQSSSPPKRARSGTNEPTNNHRRRQTRR